MIKAPYTRNVRKVVVAAGMALGIMMPAAAQAPSLAMLDKLDQGLWEIRDRDTQDTQRICLRTGRELLQLRHPRMNCNRTVVQDGAKEITVQYTCRGKGYGRTNIRRETGSLVQIAGQGIAGDMPFSFSAEARRTGACK